MDLGVLWSSGGSLTWDLTVILWAGCKGPAAGDERFQDQSACRHRGRHGLARMLVVLARSVP